MKILGKYLLIALIVGIICLSLFIAINQGYKTTIRSSSREITPSTSNVIPLPSNILIGYLALLLWFVLPPFLFILSLIYSIKETKKGYMVSVIGSLLISAIYLLIFILFGIYNSIFHIFVGEENMAMLFMLLMAIILIFASFIINSVVYAVRK